MNLISNTGFQLFTFRVEFSKNNNFKIYFYESYDVENSKLRLEMAHYFANDEVWVKKYDLSQLGYAVNGEVKSSWGEIKKDFEEEFTPITIETDDPLDSGCFEVSLGRFIDSYISKFENKWFPLPFFLLEGNVAQSGPSNWCRFKLLPVDSPEKNIKKYDLLLAFDTKTTYEADEYEDEGLNENPFFTNNYDRVKYYKLCNSEQGLMQFCSNKWVDKYILKHFYGVSDINDHKNVKPKMKYLAQYLFLIRYLDKLDILPKIKLHSDKANTYCNVDLVIDIGNSRTCALLFDDGDFTKSTPLALQNFTKSVTKEGGLNQYREPFDMRLAFRRADFGGDFGIKNSQQFIYPSMVRLGKEASELIHIAKNENTLVEKTSVFSSPKRFLWDDKKGKKEWEFIELDGEVSQAINIKGVSEQLNLDGSLNLDVTGHTVNRYSRRALMTFAFMEILTQAKMQINSNEQLMYWGNIAPRKIDKIIVTCPTAMSKKEQIALRKCAEDASIILDNFFSGSYEEDVSEKELRKRVKIIPSSDNLSHKEGSKEWIYDEATASQFVFLYAEISQRYNNKVKDYFDFYGKYRGDIENYDRKTLTIGSVDIGAGTTDIMVSAYKYDDSKGKCRLQPVPLFWESFYKAGDDLLKELVTQLVVEGSYSAIEQEMKKLNYSRKDIVDKNNAFFGGNNGMSARNKQLRSSFNFQISIPIVTHFLEMLKNEEKQIILTFDEIFNTTLPADILFNRFKENFGFDFKDLKWEYNPSIVTQIIEKTFDTMIGKISSLFSHFECDIVLLSGRPTSLRPVTDLFLKYYAISPNRLKSMNDYRVGLWYPQDKRFPFIDGSGYFVNPKSIVTTGAMIGYIAQNGGFKGFSLDLTKLIKKMKPTTKYFGMLDSQLKYEETIISMDTNRRDVVIDSLPFRIGVRQLDVQAYPSRPFYTLDFDESFIEERIENIMDEEKLKDINSVQRAIKIEKNKILQRMPITISVVRDINEDIEQLDVEQVLDKNGDSLNTKYFNLQIQSMSEIDDFWLDSGIFSLNIDTH